jgi:hypothetical protein
MTRAKSATKRVELPGRFVPGFWNNADGRSMAVKEIRRRYRNLREDAAVDSYQKDLLVQRAVFIALQLETMEIAAASGKPFDAGVYTQMTNSLLGLLKSLGLEKQVTKVANLKSYIEGRGK